MADRPDEFRHAYWKQLREDIVVQQDIAALLRDGRMKTHSQNLGEGFLDTTEASAKHCD